MASRTKTGSMMIAAAAAFTFAPMSAFALTGIRWGASTDGNYSDGSSWTNNTNGTHYIPGSTVDQNDTYIWNGHVVTVNSDVSSNNNLRYFYLNVSGPTNPPLPNSITAGSQLYVTTNGNLGVGQELNVGGGGTITVDGGTLTGGSSSGSRFSGNSLGDATLNVSGGTFNSYDASFNGNAAGDSVVNLSGTGIIDAGTNHSIILGGNFNGSKTGVQSATAGQGIVNQTGGSLKFSNRGLFISNGAYNISAGTLTTGASSYGIQVGALAAGSFNMTGGTVTTGVVQLGVGTGGNGLLAVSNGTLNIADTITIGGAVPDGIFRITGSAATITSTKGAGASPLKMNANGTLNFQIGSTGVSPITINTSTDYRNGTLLAGTLDIDTIGGFSPAAGDYFDLILNKNNYTGTSGGNFTNGYDITALQLAAADVGHWTFGVVAGVNGYNVLRVTAVPEPTSLSLLGLGGLLMLKRRRRAV